MSLNQNRKIKVDTFLPACGGLMFCHVRVQPGMRAAEVVRNKTSERLVCPAVLFLKKKLHFVHNYFWIHSYNSLSPYWSIYKFTDVFSFSPVCVRHKVSQAITFHIKTEFNCFLVTFANILQWKSCKNVQTSKYLPLFSVGKQEWSTLHRS